MSYEANFDTAKTYLMAGLTERAREGLLAALNEVDPAHKKRDNVVYFRILAMLAKLAMQRDARAEAAMYIEEGLRVKPDHTDLLFMKALCCWEEKQFDEMFGAVVTYLLSYGSADRARYECEFQGEGALQETFRTLIPVSYRKSATRRQTLDVVRRLSETTRNPLVQRAYDIMLAINASESSNAEERAAS